MASPTSTIDHTGQPQPGRLELLLVAVCALAASAAAIWWSWANSAFLLYGDAEAHIHIARRLFDSHRPGLGQLGSVWLPLPHLLLAPFVAVDSWWRSGFAGVIPSAACYLLACLGLYRLMRKWVSPMAAGFGTAFFALNPNLLYMQTTAMSEPLFLCLLIWAVLLAVEWHAGLDTEGEGRRLWLLIAVLVAAVMTRYDGWILAFLIWAAMAACLARRKRLVRPGFVLASIVLLLAPLAWMGYNAALFGDWLDFMRGPYSAAAIELRTSNGAIPPHPGWHNPWVSALFFLKAADMDSLFSSIFFVLAGVFGISEIFMTQSERGQSISRGKAGARRALWLLFLWLPLPFYAYSVSFGSVPIFLPVWWPHSYYNTRYGMELLPAFALLLALVAQGIWLEVRRRWAWSETPPGTRTMGSILALLIIWDVAAVLHNGPIVFIEAQKNAEARGYYNRVIPETLARLHAADPAAQVLMDTSSFPSIVPHAGLTYAQTINESDKEFFDAALAAPAEHVSIVLAFAGDEVDKGVKAHPARLHAVQSFRSKDQPDATIYAVDGFPGTGSAPGDSTAPIAR
jgi:hypothetical protein